LQSVAVAAFRIVSWNNVVIVELVFNYPVTYNANSSYSTYHQVPILGLQDISRAPVIYSKNAVGLLTPERTLCTCLQVLLLLTPTIFHSVVISRDSAEPKISVSASQGSLRSRWVDYCKQANCWTWWMWFVFAVSSLHRRHSDATVSLSWGADGRQLWHAVRHVECRVHSMSLHLHDL